MTLQAYIDNTKEKTGNGPSEFKQLAVKKGWMKEGKLRADVRASLVVAWLKEDFSLGHGHSLAIVAVLKGANPGEK